MQLTPFHAAAPGFHVLNANAAVTSVRRQGRPSHVLPPWTTPTDERQIVCLQGQHPIDFYRRRANLLHAEARRDVALWLRAGAGALGMFAVYLALFFAAAHMRAANHSHPTAPLSAPLIPGAADTKF